MNLTLVQCVDQKLTHLVLIDCVNFWSKHCREGTNSIAPPCTYLFQIRKLSTRKIWSIFCSTNAFPCYTINAMPFLKGLFMTESFIVI